MRKIIIALAVAAAATFSFGAASQAAGVTIQLGDSGYHHHNRYERDRHHHRHDRHARHWRHHHRCHTERVVRHHHGRRYVKEYRVCR